MGRTFWRLFEAVQNGVHFAVRGDPVARPQRIRCATAACSQRIRCAAAPPRNRFQTASVIRPFVTSFIGGALCENDVAS